MIFANLLWDELSESARAVLPQDADVGLRLAVAKGLVPLSARDLLSTLYHLCGDPEPRVRKSAKKNLRELPESLVIVGLTGEANPKILHYLATRSFDNHHIHEKVALNRGVSLESLVHLAGNATHDRVIDIIGRNEQAILSAPAIILRLSQNAAAPRHLVDRLIAFYATARGRSYLDDLPEELKAETPAPVAPPPELEEIEPPRPLDPEEEVLHPGFRIEDLLSPEFDVAELFAADLVGDAKDAEEPKAKRDQSLHARIARMAFVDRLLLALKGNAEARRFLVKSPNKTIQDCVLRNPRLSTQEIVEMARERSTSANVILSICRSREWSRFYEVALQLCWHPKTPVRYAVQFLSRLTPRDLEKLGGSKMVPTATAAQARNLLRRRDNR